LYRLEVHHLKGSRSGEKKRADALGLRLWRMSWLMFVVGQGLLATAWWWLSAGGFGPGHPRFWVNQAAAPTVAIAVIVTLAALRRESPGPLRWLLAAWAAAWAGMAIALRIVFPITMAWLCQLCCGRHKFHDAEYRVMPLETLVIWFHRPFTGLLGLPLARTTRHNLQCFPGFRPARRSHAACFCGCCPPAGG
jgi:hypothetical protein